MNKPEFKSFESIPRLFRGAIITEKLDGTNAQVHITEAGDVFAGSRNRWITPEDDNHGFARWVAEHAEELRQLGPGSHYGEWWGFGIQRGYGLKEKRFSLFNTGRWGAGGKDEANRPACCHVVPVMMAVDAFDTAAIQTCLVALEYGGSRAAPGFMKPEGIVVWHEAGRVLFKATLDGDGHKGGRKVQ